LVNINSDFPVFAGPTPETDLELSHFMTVTALAEWAADFEARDKRRLTLLHRDLVEARHALAG
jgi:hypothetical protein